jgi:hypothetical protein
LASGEGGFYNLNQLVCLHRTRNGGWFPFTHQRVLCDEGFREQFRSNVWFLESQLSESGVAPLPGMRPMTTTWDGKRAVLYNAAQLTPPHRAHVYGDALPVNSVTDRTVLSSVAERNGFTSNAWCAVSRVGGKPGVRARAKAFCPRYGVVPVYNEDQLVWPIPVPDPPHRWGNGSHMLPHYQEQLELARQQQGFASRVWYKAGFHRHKNNVRPGAVLITIDLGIPLGNTPVLNATQLIDVNV